MDSFPLEFISSLFVTFPNLLIQTFTKGLPSAPLLNALVGYFGLTHFKHVISILLFPFTEPFSGISFFF